MAKKNIKARVRRIVENMLDMVSANPKSYNQQSFPEPNSVTHVCDTAYCAAGHIIAAASIRKFDALCKQDAEFRDVNWSREAAAVLGIHPYSDLAGTLFGSAGDWPKEFRVKWYKAVTQRGKVSAFKARWKSWLDTDGTDGNPHNTEAFAV